MHAFTTALPEHHAIPGIPSAANTALVVCGYHPGNGSYYGQIAGAPSAFSGIPPLRREDLTLNELLRWFVDLQIGLPGGLGTHLRRDGFEGSEKPWNQYYWGEQGPELRGLIDQQQFQEGNFLPIFFGVTTPA